MISIVIIVSTVINLKIVFPGDAGSRLFCYDLRLQPLSINTTSGANSGSVTSGAYSGITDSFPSAFYLMDQEIIDYYMVLFLPSSTLFLVSVTYLIVA
ncbi:Sodium/potassium/calcium exchanger 5 [Bienertia sinuspersici]